MAGWLDGVKRQDFGTNGGSWTRQPALIVVHSTETGYHGWPGYDGGSSCPHFTLDPQTGEARQHVSLGYAARALKNPSGGVETNRGGAVQIEVIGTCDPANKGKGYLYLPGATSDLVRTLKPLLNKISSACGIPLTTSVDFEPYPSPGYGSGPPRLSSSAWQSYRGVLGHQHVPENDHGDPGNIDMATILSGDDDDMPTAKDVWQTDGLIAAPDRTSDDYWTGSSFMHNMGEWVLQVRDYTQNSGPIQQQLDAIQSDLAELQAVKTVTAPTGPLMSALEALAARVEDLAALVRDPGADTGRIP